MQQEGSYMLDRSSGILSTNAKFDEAVKMDLFSDVFRVVKPEGALFFNGEFPFPGVSAHPDRILKYLSSLVGFSERVAPE